MEEKNLLSRIERKPEIMFGKPVIKGTRLPVDLLLEKLAYGYTDEKLAEEYPFITKEDYFQMQRYLHSAKMKLGLIVNFHSYYLYPKRILNSNV